MTMKSPKQAWNDDLERKIVALIEDTFERHFFIGAFGEEASKAKVEWVSKLVSLEKLRADIAVRRWGEGLRGAALAASCAPVATEVEWFDPQLRMHGFCDELWSDGDKVRPVELKTSPHSENHVRANRSQAAAYGYLAKSAGGHSVAFCEVEYLRDGYRDRFKFGATWERTIRREVQSASKLMMKSEQPLGTPSKAVCAWCPFQLQCPESEAPSVDESMGAREYFQ